MWINTHALPNAALNIRPFIAGACHAPANAHDTFFFSFTEIVNQTHIDLLLGRHVLDAPAPISVMRVAAGWKLLDLRFWRDAPNRFSSSVFMSPRSKPL